MLMTRDDICGLARLTLILPSFFIVHGTTHVVVADKYQTVPERFKYLDVAHTRKFVV